MAMRYLVARMRTPAVVAPRPPSVSCGSTAPRSRPLSANPRQGEHDNTLRMSAKKKYEFYLDHLEGLENDLNYVRVFTERIQRAIKYMTWSSMIVLPAHFVFVVWEASRKPESSSTSDFTSTSDSTST